MRILSSEFIRNFPQKIINIHPADTRLHQGLHAYEWAFQNQMSETKVTVHYVNEGVDTGQIIAQTTVDLSGAQTLDEVEQRGLAIEHQFYAQTLKELFLKNE
jgi:phosphoribosylglycinamide formyltransferase-1